MKDGRTLGQYLADSAAKRIGSWTFIVVFLILITVWSIANNFEGNKAIDPYPYTFLNLILSLIAGIQAPIIMISQNRQEEIQRKIIEDIQANSKATYEIGVAISEILKEHTVILDEIADDKI